MTSINADIIKEAAAKVGFDLCGIAPVREFADERRFFEGWLADGFGEGLEYLGRNIEKRFSVGELVPGARSVICCGVSYKNDSSCGYGGSNSPKVASYARAATYQENIKQMLSEMASLIEEQCGAFARRAFSDTAPVLEKRWAAEAGLGFIGHNSLLISPTHGSFILLGELVVDFTVDRYDAPYSGAGCGECRRCAEHCPSGAITDRGIDTRRCISRLTIEKDEVADTAPLHGWIFGCDECQSVCPYNIKAPFYKNPRFAPLFDPTRMTTEEWLSLSGSEFAERFHRTPLMRAGRDRILSVISHQASVNGQR